MGGVLAECAKEMATDAFQRAHNVLSPPKKERLNGKVCVTRKCCPRTTKTEPKLTNRLSSIRGWCAI